MKHKTCAYMRYVFCKYYLSMCWLSKPMPIIVVYGSSFLLKGVAKVRNKKLMSFLKVY